MKELIGLFLGGAGKFLATNVLKIVIAIALGGSLIGGVYYVVNTIKENSQLKDANKKLEHDLSLLTSINKDNVDQSDKDNKAGSLTVDAVGKDAEKRKGSEKDTSEILSDLDRREKEIIEGKPKIDLKMSKDPIEIKKKTNPISKLIVKDTKPKDTKPIVTVVKQQETTVTKKDVESQKDFELSAVRYDAVWDSYCRASNDVKNCQAG